MCKCAAKLQIKVQKITFFVKKNIYCCVFVIFFVPLQAIYCACSIVFVEESLETKLI